jgi:hypothetical protein
VLVADNHRRALTAAVVVAALLVPASCGSDSGTDDAAASTISAEVASFDLAAGRDERFTVGFFAGDNRVLAYGTVTLRFAFAGTRDAPQQQAVAGPSVEASYLPVAGQSIDPDRPGPRLVAPSEARGVYGATGVRFDQPGIWVVVAEGNAGDDRFEVDAAFEVKAEPQVVAVGEPAPRTESPVAGQPGVDPESIDSRAADGAAIPDPDLHSISVAGALAGGRPVVVVVSTPVFCVSRFCGPITDSVQALAQEFGDRVAFVHLEVWQDFENQLVNPAAEEWIAPADGSDLREPWVFVVGADGVVRDRFDNAVTDAELRRAVEAVAG